MNDKLIKKAKEEYILKFVHVHFNHRKLAIQINAKNVQIFIFMYMWSFVNFNPYNNQHNALMKNKPIKQIRTCKTNRTSLSQNVKYDMESLNTPLIILTIVNTT